MDRRFNILLSSAGRRVSLLQIFRATLKQMNLDGRVLATDMSRLSSAALCADATFVVPKCSHPEFVGRMLQICRENDVSLIVPTIDTELPVYAANRDRFEAIGTRVAVSSPEVVAVAGDKERTHAWLTENGFPTVKQLAVSRFLELGAPWPFPLLVKPRDGSASIGVARVENRKELEIWARDGYLVQTLAPGEEYTTDFLADRSGRCRCTVPRRRLEVRAGEVSKGMTARLDSIESLARRLCEALPGAYGALNVQALLDQASGELNVIEINPRFGGGFPLAWEAGAHFPKWIIEEIIGIPSTASQAAWRGGLVMLRYDAAVFASAAELGL